MMTAWLVWLRSLESTLEASGLAFAWPVLLLFLRSSLLLAVAWALTRLMRSSAARHLVWSVSLAGLLLLPFGTLLPAVELAVLPAEDGGVDRAETAAAEAAAAGEIERRDAFGGHHSTVQRPQASGFRSSGAPRTRSEAIGSSEVSIEATHRSFVASSASLLPALPVAIWLLGVAVLMLRVVGGLRARRHLLAGATSIEDRRREQMGRLARRLAISRPVRLLESEAVQVPMTWGTLAPVVLLPRRAREWSHDLLETVLLHELVHVERRDAPASLLAALVTALYWPQPLVWIAARALRRESELACDDEVVRTSGSAVRYAEHLLHVVEALRRPVPRAVAAMASQPRLAGRIGAILDESRQRSAPGRMGRLVIALGAALVVSVAAVPVTLAAMSSDAAGAFVALGADEAVEPRSESRLEPQRAVEPSAASASIPTAGATSPPASTSISISTSSVGGPAPLAAPRPTTESSDFVSSSAPAPGGERLFAEGCGDGSHATSFHVDDDRLRIRVEVGQCELRIDSVSGVELGPDERSVASISRGGHLTIEERRPGSTRRLRMEPGAAGRPRISWQVDGDSEPFDDRAEAWLAKMIPQIYRLTGWEAEARVGRILAAGGPESVFHEVSLIFGDHVQRLYLSELLEQAGLEGDELRRWIEVAGEELGSDFELGEALQALPLDQLRDPAIQQAFVDAAATIGSDNGLRTTLEHLLQQGDLSPELLEPLLRVAGSIGSDFELGELVVAITARYPRGAPLPDVFYDVVGTIGSDHEMRRALGQVIGRPMASGDLARALELSKEIGSDFELTELLVELLSVYPADEPLPGEFFDAAATIGSDHEMHRALAAVLGRPMGDEETTRLLELSNEIGSDFEHAELLIDLVRRRGVPETSREAFQSAVESIGNRVERQRVLDAWERAGT